VGAAGAPPPRLVPAPSAPLGRSDVTRRWALAPTGGAPRFAGVTRPEGEGAIPWLAAIDPAGWDGALIAVTLPVVLAEGAGPYLIDVDGRLVLAVAPHPRLAGAHVAMGPAEPRQPIGLIRPAAEGGWRWLARAEVEPADRLAALDEVDEVADEVGARAWGARWGRVA
jgi:hypothetical protein